MTPLDPRAPLVLDTHDLGRRPGSEHSVSRTDPAPPDLGIAMLRVPEGSDIDLDLRLEAVMEGVLVSGSATVTLEGECVRCLGPIGDTLTASLQELYAYDADPDDEEISRMHGDLLDLDPILRDAVVLNLPQNPLCKDDCPGLCPECGARLEDDPDHSHGEVLDPRWSVLGDLDVAPQDDSASSEGN